MGYCGNEDLKNLFLLEEEEEDLEGQEGVGDGEGEGEIPF